MSQATGRAAFSPEDAVRARYAEAARAVEPALCCPVSYAPRLLEAGPPRDQGRRRSGPDRRGRLLRTERGLLLKGRGLPWSD